MSRQRFEPLAMPLDGVRLIEASAGTGKTFSLAGLYLRLIVEKQAAVRDILVMTFTRAATQELRERIRRRLVAAAQLAQQSGAGAQNAEDEFAQALIAASDEPRDAVARRLADAAQRMDEAAIVTIHGFCQRAAAENAFDSGLAFDRGEPVDDSVVYEEVVADFWRKHALGQAATAGFAATWGTADSLYKTLKPLLDKPHVGLADVAPQQVAELRTRLQKDWRDHGELLCQRLQEAETNGALRIEKGQSKLFSDYGDFEGAWEDLESRIQQAAPGQCMLLPAWVAALARPDSVFKKQPAAADALGQEICAIPLAQTLSLLQPLAYVLFVDGAVTAVQAQAQTRKRERRQFSYADLIAALHTAVTDADTGPRLAAALHTAWPWALVDEFQDTDPLQYEILRRIYAQRETGGLLLIGDPKQAIFGFRGGDIFAYLSAAADTSGQAYSLDTNFRSTQSLLDAVEALFRSPGDNTFLVDGIAYQTVRAGRPGARMLRLDGATVSPMTIWHLAPEQTNKDSAERACLQGCVDQIRRLLDPDNQCLLSQQDGESGQFEDRALAPHDIAVLVNTNAQAAEVQRALARVGIAAVCLHQSSVFDSAEARDVLQVLKAAAEPADERLLRGALAGQLLGCRLGDLIAMADDEARWQREVARFQAAHLRWRTNGVLALLQPLIQAAAERLLAYEDGERRVSNFLQLAELLAAAESQTFGSTGLLRWLRDSIRNPRQGQGSEAELLRLESDAALVRITTVHKAKGLEYPVVLLPFAPWLGSKGEPAKPPLAFHDKDRHAHIDIIGNERNRDQSVREARAEAVRLLYVALTRAEIACFLLWGAANSTPNSALASLLHRADGVTPEFWGSNKSAKPLTNEQTGARLAALSEQRPDSIAIKSIPAAAGPGKRLQSAAAPTGAARMDLPATRPPWSLHSFTRLVRAAEPGPALAGAEDEAQDSALEAEGLPIALSNLPGGPAFGSAVHRLLETALGETIDNAQWPVPDAALAEPLRQQVAATLRRYGMVLAAGQAGEQAIAATAILIGNGLHTRLPEIGPLAAIPAGRLLSELEFMLRLDGGSLQNLLDLLAGAGYTTDLRGPQQQTQLRGLMHGYIDLVVEHQGRYYVLDYKTNWLGPNSADYERQALQTTMQQHHYDLQYLIYIVALHRYLGQRLDGYDPEQHLGGALYLFLRGMAPDAGTRGIYFDRPGSALIKRLDSLLDGAVSVA